MTTDLLLCGTEISSDKPLDAAKLRPVRCGALWSVQIPLTPTAATDYATIVAKYKAAGVLVGRYLSGDSQAPADRDSYPLRNVAYPQAMCRYIGTYQNKRITPDRRNKQTRVTIAQQAAGVLAKEAVEAFVSQDNQAHPTKWHDAPTLAQTIDAMSEQYVRTSKPIMVNYAVSPADLTDGELDAMCAASDFLGWCFEQPFHPTAIRPSMDKVLAELAALDRLVRAGCIVRLIHNNFGERKHEVRFLAAMVMMIRQPGDNIFVDRDFFGADPDWIDWPNVLGAPTGPYRLNAGERLFRSFSHGAIDIDTTFACDPTTLAQAVTLS